MTSTRSYGEACPIAHSMDMIGDRWAMLILRELRLGPRRFTDLQASLPNAGPNMLAQRLRDLERYGVIAKRTLPAPAPAKIYKLTEWGSELEPVFRALARWGVRAPVPPSGDRVSPDSMMLGLRTFFKADNDAPWSATYHVRLGRELYRLRIVNGDLAELTRGMGDAPVTADAGRDVADVTITGDDHTSFHTLVNGIETLETLIDRGELTVSGDVAAIHRLVAAIQKSQPTPK